MILISLGLIAVILSFLVPERKKSLISLLLAAVIVIAGVIQYSQQSFSQNRWRKRMESLQRDRKVDMEELREKLKAKAGQAQKKMEKVPSK